MTTLSLRLLALGESNCTWYWDQAVMRFICVARGQMKHEIGWAERKRNANFSDITTITPMDGICDKKSRPTENEKSEDCKRRDPVRRWHIRIRAMQILWAWSWMKAERKNLRVCRMQFSFEPAHSHTSHITRTEHFVLVVPTIQLYTGAAIRCYLDRFTFASRLHSRGLKQFLLSYSVHSVCLSFFGAKMQYARVYTRCTAHKKQPRSRD